MAISDTDGAGAFDIGGTFACDSNEGGLAVAVSAMTTRRDPTSPDCSMTCGTK